MSKKKSFGEVTSVYLDNKKVTEKINVNQFDVILVKLNLGYFWFIGVEAKEKLTQDTALKSSYK